MKSGVVILISGTSGAGKNTIIKGMLAANKYKFISSYTTRKKRDCDMPNQYQYISVREFESKIKSGEIFEYDIFNDEYYGTSKKIFHEALKETDVVLKDISCMGHANIFEALEGELNLVSVFLTQQKKVLKQRLINRCETKQRIKNRLSLYKKEQAQIPKYNFVIKNTIYNRTVEKMIKIAELALGEITLLPTKGSENLQAKKIDKYASKLEAGKYIKPILITLYNNNLFIVEGLHRYLAGLKTGKNVVKKFVDDRPKNTSVNKEEWEKIIKAYTI